MRAGLATIEVLESEGLGANALAMGDRLRRGLNEALSGYEMVKGAVGVGLLNGIQFTTPGKVRLRLLFEAFMAIHKDMFGQVVVMRLFRDHGILTQMCGNNFMTLKAAPPLVVTESEIDEFIASARNVVDVMHNSTGFWTEALGLARRVANV